MKYIVKNRLPGRLHLKVVSWADKSVRALTLAQAGLIMAALERLPGVLEIKIYERTAGVVVQYASANTLEKIQESLATLRKREKDLLPVAKRKEESLALNSSYKYRLLAMVVRHFAVKLLVPLPVRVVLRTWRAWHFLTQGINSLLHRRLDVAVLDATAIGASLAQKDSATAGTIMFLLKVGELLEEWTLKKSVTDLAASMSLNIAKAWVVEAGVEHEVEIDLVRTGDLVAVKMGSTIPLDGVVVDGEALVNQASMTGESLPVRKKAEALVYAGTVLEEGELTIKVSSRVGETRYERIVAMIENSEALKSQVESRTAGLADRLVPYSLGATILTYLLTGNVTKAMSILMVDFSCALKLAMPLAFLSAMRECSKGKITVKGGKFLEAVAQADTIVFDKTGTLTKAQPEVVNLVNFSKYSREELLAYAACLEEHFPHAVANAIVHKAFTEDISHAEMHSKVEYVVAHGIASTVNGLRIVIGSKHFVLEDEQCKIPKGKLHLMETISAEYSHIYMAIAGKLVAIICIRDSLRAEARETITALRAAGFSHAVMMTGDSEKTAAAVADQLGLDEYYSQVLPEDKANYIKQVKARGSKVIMVGDGINDSPALSAADAGIAIAQGADIARQVADITIGAEDLRQLVVLKQISTLLMERIEFNYHFIVSFNVGLIGLGLVGVLPPATSALLHNLSTLGIGMHSMQNVLTKAKSA